ncbi:MAG: DUF87 domain-containing protein, partial [Candidatus Absconditabacterales bacterium]
MINKAIHLAQTLGEQLANTSLTWQFLNTPNIDNYATIQLIPYKHLKDTFTGWYGILRSFIGTKAKLYCGVIGNKNHIDLYVMVPKTVLQTVESSLYTLIGELDIKYVKNPSIDGLKYLMPSADPGETILFDGDFKKDSDYLDPFMDIINLFAQIDDNVLHVSYCIDFDMGQKSWLDKAQVIASKYIVNPLFGNDDKAKDQGKPSDPASAQYLQAKFAVGYHLEDYHPGLDKTIQSSFAKFLKSGSRKGHNSYKTFPLALGQIINFFHIPSEKIINNLTYLPYRKLPFPNNIPTLDSMANKNDLTIIGKTDFKSQGITFGITREDKLRHMYIIGKTGVGKSNLIANLARSDMISNKGICVIDPHGDLIDDIIGQVPSYRINDVVLFDVADREWPVGFNVLEHEKPEEKPLIASGIVSIFKKLYGNSRGPRLEYILRNVILSILEYPNATLMHLIRMLTDSNFREEVLEYVKDPVIMKFWRDEFDKWPDKQREEAISPISNKVGQFTSSQIIRNIFSQTKSKINFRKLMDEGKIVLINLSKGKIGEDSTNLLGSFVVSKIQIDAMSRADLAEANRKDFYLYIDEFQNFATESFATILSEARKYKLGLIVANQYSSQLDEVTRGAIFGNVGSIISMTLGYDDAVIMANQFKAMVSANDFLDIPKFKAYIKLMIHGIVSDPFSMQTIALPPGDDIEGLKDKIRQQSRSRYAIGRLELEELIKVRAERSFSKTEKAVLAAKAKNGGVIKEISAEDGKPSFVVSKPVIEVKPAEAIPVAQTETKTAAEPKPFVPKMEPAEQEKTPLAPKTQKDQTTSTQDIKKQIPEKKPFVPKETKSEKKKEEKTNEPINHNVMPENFEGDVFQKLSINDTQPDQVLRDAIKKDHKAIFFNKPEGLDDLAKMDTNKKKGERYMKGKFKVYEVFVNMYEHLTLISPDKAGVDIRVGSAQEVQQQMQNGFTNLEKRFLIDRDKASTKPKENTTKSEKETMPTDTNSVEVTEAQIVEASKDVPVQNEPINESASIQPQETPTVIEADETVAIESPSGITEYQGVKVGKTYEGYVKLKYNYGLFVTVGEVDGLLHKKFIDCPEGISWKKLY